MTVGYATRTNDTDDDRGFYLAWAIVFQIATFIVEPFVVVKLWSWFLVPLGLPALRWVTAFGVNIIVSVIVFRYPGERSNKEIFNACVSMFWNGVVALGIAYIALKLGS